MTNTHAIGLLAVTVALAGCVSVPVGPSIAVTPGPGRSGEQFALDDRDCRSFALTANRGAAAAATDGAAAFAAGSAAVGAVSGAIIGAATGDAGAGAAIGAGSGLLWGSAVAAPGYTSHELQRRYNAYYAQCMYARGHQFPGRLTVRTAPYPPPNTPAPALAGAPSAPRAVPGATVTTPPAAAALPGNHPPPGTPAPSGIDPASRGRVAPAPTIPPPKYPPPGTLPPATPPPGTPPPA